MNTMRLYSGMLSSALIPCVCPIVAAAVTPDKNNDDAVFNPVAPVCSWLFEPLTTLSAGEPAGAPRTNMSLKSGVPDVPSQRTHPAGMLASAPYHMTIVYCARLTGGDTLPEYPHGNMIKNCKAPAPAFYAASIIFAIFPIFFPPSVSIPIISPPCLTSKYAMTKDKTHSIPSTVTVSIALR